MQEDIVRASEIGEFCFCKRAWWLTYTGRRQQTEAMKVGIINHDKLALQTERFHRLKLAGYMLISLGISGIMLYLLLKVFFSIL